MSFIELFMFTSGILLFIYAGILFIRAVGVMFVNWASLVAALITIGISVAIDLLGCLLIWGASR